MRLTDRISYKTTGTPLSAACQAASVPANPAPIGSVVNLTCNASDNDESSMLKQESLDYSWSCAYGQITSENNDNKATWVSPDIVGAYSISCTVTDQYNGVDIYTIEVIVE